MMHEYPGKAATRHSYGTNTDHFHIESCLTFKVRPLFVNLAAKPLKLGLIPKAEKHWRGASRAGLQLRTFHLA